jgi:hypothetical protein
MSDNADGIEFAIPSERANREVCLIRRLGMDRRHDTQGSEDTTQARDNLTRVARDHEALQAQARRVEATAPESTKHPIQGMEAQAAGSEDNSQNIRELEQVAENTRAMKEQARRVEATVPPGIRTKGPRDRR